MKKWRKQNMLSRSNIAFEQKCLICSVYIEASVFVASVWHRHWL